MLTAPFLPVAIGTGALVMERSSLGAAICTVRRSRSVDLDAAKARRVWRHAKVSVGWLFVHGTPDAVADTVAAYARAGLDRLILMSALPEMSQVSALAEPALPLSS